MRQRIKLCLNCGKGFEHIKGNGKNEYCSTCQQLNRGGRPSCYKRRKYTMNKPTRKPRRVGLFIEWGGYVNK